MFSRSSHAWKHLWIEPCNTPAWLRPFLLGKDSYFVVADYSFLEVRLDHFFSQFVWYLDKQPKHDLNLFHLNHTTDIIFYSVSIVSIHHIMFFFGCVPEGQLPGFLGIPLNYYWPPQQEWSGRNDRCRVGHWNPISVHYGHDFPSDICPNCPKTCLSIMGMPRVQCLQFSKTKLLKVGTKVALYSSNETVVVVPK